MPNKHAPRAQLFQPFDSLKGLHDMLRQQEEIKRWRSGDEFIF